METTETIQEPKRLARPREGRWLGGVCAALAQYFELDALIYRIAFVALSLAGGTGILLYAAAWLVIPAEDAEDSVAAEWLKRHRDRPGRVIALGFVAFVVVVTLSSVHWWPSAGNLWLAAALAGAAIVWWQASGRGRTDAPRRPWLGAAAAATLVIGFGTVGLVDASTGADIDWRYVFAIAAIALGALTAAGIAAGHPVGSVIALGFVVLALLAVSLVVRVPIFSGVGDRTLHPASISALDDRYRLGIGNLDVDLTDVDFPLGRSAVKTTLGVGDLTVRVPEDVTVVVDARASAGQVDLFGRTEDGTSVHSHLVDPGLAPHRVLVLDARVGLGQVEVVRG